MTTVEYQVGNGADDVLWATGYYSNSVVTFPFGTNWSSNPYRCGARWAGVTIPAGAIITTSYCSFYYYSKVGTPPECTIYFEDAADPSAISNESDGFSRTLTTASVSVTHPLSGTWWNTPSINTIIQELVNSYSYASGAAMQLIVIGGGVSSNYGSSFSYNQNSIYGPKLHIEYTTSGSLVPNHRRRFQSLLTR